MTSPTRDMTDQAMALKIARIPTYAYSTTLKLLEQTQLRSMLSTGAYRKNGSPSSFAVTAHVNTSFADEQKILARLAAELCLSGVSVRWTTYKLIENALLARQHGGEPASPTVDGTSDYLVIGGSRSDISTLTAEYLVDLAVTQHMVLVRTERDPEHSLLHLLVSSWPAFEMSMVRTASDPGLRGAR